jgi:hypothetical protein
MLIRPDNGASAQLIPPFSAQYCYTDRCIAAWQVLSQNSIFGQNPKIGCQEFNDLQTPKLSKKQLCDRTSNFATEPVGKTEPTKFEAEQPTKPTDCSVIFEPWQQTFPPQTIQGLLLMPRSYVNMALK